MKFILCKNSRHIQQELIYALLEMEIMLCFLSQLDHVFLMYNSLLLGCSVFEGALKKIKKMSIQSHPGVSDDVDEEKMLHAFQADGSESWK